ncbi:hypothetical protein MTO96_029002 [Rhipicephalus appendiculatus]
MATAIQRKYDPAAMAWTQIDVQQAATTQHEPTNIEDEGLFQLVTLRRKPAQQKMRSKPAAGNPGGPVSSGRARTAHPKGNLIKWRPRDTPKMSTDDIIVVLKPRETLHLKTAFQTGDLGAAIAQYVGGEAAATVNVWPVWTQSLIVCGTQHVKAANKLARDWNLKRKFRRLQRPRNKQGAPRSKTNMTSGNGGASSGKSGQATGPAPANKTSKKDENRNACGQSAKTPVSQEGNFLSLDNSKAATTKVSNWAGVAATFSSSPSPLELELKKEIAFLRTKNEQLEQKINALQSGRTEPPLPGTLDSGDESASLCSGMGPVTYGPLMSNLESRMTALEKSVTDPMAPLPTMIAQIIQAQMQQLVTTLTQQITVAVTRNVKSWIQASPKLFRLAGPVKEVGRPSKVCRNIDEDGAEDVPLVTALQAAESQPASNSVNHGAGT